MNDTTEPLAAILAEMRDFADHRAADAGGERHAVELLRSYADRIEAAAKRERERAPGNAAAMREALEEQSRYWWSHIRNYSENEMLKRTDAALSAPARNCDRFATAEEAVAAFADHLRAWENAHGVCSEYPDHPVQVPSGAFSWLFATAEGGVE